MEKLPARLRGYASWLPQTWRIVVVVDRDDDDCVALKQGMEQMAADVGLCSRSASAAATWRVVNRIAIEELEAWYFGDWEAVRAVYPRVSAAARGCADEGSASVAIDALRTSAHPTVTDLCFVGALSRTIYTEDGKPIGIEITAPSKVTVNDLNRVLASLGAPELTSDDVAPLKAA